MAERDATARLRRAVKENNLFLVKRLIQRTDMRNQDTATRRYTSLAWAAVLGHEETFEFLLSAGHDDEELSRDSENNTILMLLADHTPNPSTGLYASPSAAEDETHDSSGAILRMARLYYDRYSSILDWANGQGRTALHIASLKGNEELVRMFCDLGADFDLPDNKGNTPLHYASSWGHITMVQLLIERGCQFASRNNEGFTASDYAYSFSTRDTLQDTARLTFENNKKARRNAAQAAAERASEWGSSAPISMPKLSPHDRDGWPRMRSGSGTSRSTTTASDSGDLDSTGMAAGRSHSSFSASSSPSQPYTGSNTYYHQQHLTPQPPPAMNSSSLSASGSSTTGGPGSSLGSSVNLGSALSPIANRMRERDADAREKYLLRNRSGSAGTSSIDNRHQQFTSAGPSANGDDLTALNSLSKNAAALIQRRLRPSVSAVQLRSPNESIPPAPHSTHTIRTQPETRHKASANFPSSRSQQQQQQRSVRSSSTSTSPRSLNGLEQNSDDGAYTGPPSQYAQFPEPPEERLEDAVPPTTVANRRKAFHILSKPLPSVDPPGSASHRRGLSTASVRGA